MDIKNKYVTFDGGIARIRVHGIPNQKNKLVNLKFLCLTIARIFTLTIVF